MDLSPNTHRSFFPWTGTPQYFRTSQERDFVGWRRLAYRTSRSYIHFSSLANVLPAHCARK